MSEERFVICIGEGKFAVIAGHKLNDRPLSRAAAERLAHEPAAELPPRRAAARKQMSPIGDISTAPKPAEVDLRAEPWLNAGGSAGFTIRGR